MSIMTLASCTIRVAHADEKCVYVHREDYGLSAMHKFHYSN